MDQQSTNGEVSKCKYLRTTVNTDNEYTEENKTRIGQARAYLTENPGVKYDHIE